MHGVTFVCVREREGERQREHWSCIYFDAFKKENPDESDAKA